jgi:polyphosphate kinase 2 (PPK2 family)
VLAVRVHNLVPKEVWLKRYGEINAFERQLFDNGTHILKFYLHIDKEEQLARFKQRLDDPNRHWKISESDYAEREYWQEYERAYEDAISKCSTDYAPWYIIPANHKWFRNLVVSRILVNTLESFNMKFPPPIVNIAEIKKKYHAEIQEEKRG